MGVQEGRRNSVCRTSDTSLMSAVLLDSLTPKTQCHCTVIYHFAFDLLVQPSTRRPPSAVMPGNYLLSSNRVCSGHGGAGYTFGALAILVVLPPGGCVGALFKRVCSGHTVAPATPLGRLRSWLCCRPGKRTQSCPAMCQKRASHRIRLPPGDPVIAHRVTSTALAPWSRTRRRACCGRRRALRRRPQSLAPAPRQTPSRRRACLVCRGSSRPPGRGLRGALSRCVESRSEEGGAGGRQSRRGGKEGREGGRGGAPLLLPGDAAALAQLTCTVSQSGGLSSLGGSHVCASSLKTFT